MLCLGNAIVQHLELLNDNFFLTFYYLFNYYSSTCFRLKFSKKNHENAQTLSQPKQACKERII